MAGALRTPRSARFHALCAIGDRVQAREIVGEVDGAPVHCAIARVARGMLHDGNLIGAGIKVGDVDPRWEREYCDTISDEAKAIGGGVVEAIFHSFQRLKNPAT